MASEGFDRRRERLSYTGIKENTTEETESEFVEVPIELKGHVIGKGGCMLQEIIRKSGAKISSQSKEEKGFLISGDVEQRAYAKNLILEKVEDVKCTIWELIKIPDKYKGLVMGKGGAKLREISAQTGAKVIRYKDGEVYIKLGNQEQRKNARALIGNAVSDGRIRGVEHDSNKVSRYIDGSNLPGNKVKLKQVLQKKETGTSAGPHAQYRLKPARVYETQEFCSSQSYSAYKPLLMKDVLTTLKKINHSIGAEKPKADMWCHFGSSSICVPREETVEGREWTIDEATGKFQSTSGEHFWKLAFKEGVELNERIFKGKYKERAPKDVPYVARYDLTIITPCFHQVRCKVWVSNTKVEIGLESVPSDIKNRLEEIYFEEEATCLRCRGWLVLKSMKHLQADILFPGCEFDCRFTIRARTDNALKTDPAPEEEVRNVLLEYLSGLTLTEDDAFGIRLPEKDMPEGFTVIHKRWSRRTEYTTDQGFLIILSKELTWNLGRDTRESTDVHLHCEEWDSVLCSGVWEPEAIVMKLPDFLEFVKEVQEHVFYEMKMVELRKTTPPEILARGPSALEAYKKALEGGKSSVKRVPLMLLGQHRAGKTSLKKSLKGICFDPDEDSTVGIDVDPSYFSVSTETWKTGEKTQDEDLDITISFDYHMALTMTEQLMDSLQETRKNTEIETDAEDSQDSFDTETNDVPGENYFTKPPTNAMNIHTSENPAPTPSEQTSHVSNPTENNHEKMKFPSSTVPEEIAAVAESFLRGDLTDGREDIYSTVWDFAGQSVYYVTHPLFLTARAIYCLVYDLSLSPHDIAKPVVKQGVYNEILDNCSLKTNLDYLDFWMKSVACLTSCKSKDSEVTPQSDLPPKKLPPVLLVCTHADTVFGRRNPKKAALEIFGFLKSKPYGGQLHDVFVVDNTRLKVNNSECSEVARLRRQVLSIAKGLPHINEVIPVKWLKFEKALQAAKEKGYKCITLETAEEIGRKACDIDDDGELRALVNYLHDLRSIIHFDDTEELNKMIILNPQWLIDVFKKVITIKPHDAEENNYSELWCKLERKGILDEKLLAHVWGRLFNEKETCNSVIEIMKKFCLLYPWPSDASNSKSYLVPSMLKSSPPKRISELTASAIFPSLFIKFENGQVPLGFFPRFVLQFLQWGREKLWKTGNPHLFHNFARFFTNKDDYSVILICHSSTVEIVIHGGNHGLALAEGVPSKLSLSACADLHQDAAGLTCCRAVSKQLGLMLECMRNEFFWLRSMKYEMTVACTVCCKGGAVDYCQTHKIQYCKEEQCLHFLTLAELYRSNQDIVCSRSAFADNARVQVMQFAPWFPPKGQHADAGAPDQRLVCNDEENGEKVVVLPDDVLKSLWSGSCDFKQGVCEALQLDQSSLEQPDIHIKRKIRCLARQAKCSNKSDSVIKQLREITPAGTTGPLLSDSLDVRRIPPFLARKLTIALCGGDEWKSVAEELGLDQEEIRFLDMRTLNPAQALFGYIAHQRLLTVGELYEVLCDCGLPVIADKL